MAFIDFIRGEYLFFGHNHGGIIYNIGALQNLGTLTSKNLSELELVIRIIKHQN